MSMYVVSHLFALTKHGGRMSVYEGVSFPRGYIRFLQRFGEGTYRGWMNVYWPDAEVLVPFAEYDLWEHDEDSPISQGQIGELIAIGSTVDGDFLAVHPPTSQLLWLPRHAERVERLSMDVSVQEGNESVASRTLDVQLLERDEVGASRTLEAPVLKIDEVDTTPILDIQLPEDDEIYARSLDVLFCELYGSVPEEEAFYEQRSDTRKHLFLRLPPDQGRVTLQELSDMCRKIYSPDLVIENQYVCKLFYGQLGGYVRFNYANRQEVALFYELEAEHASGEIKQWLMSQGCEL